MNMSNCHCFDYRRCRNLHVYLHDEDTVFTCAPLRAEALYFAENQTISRSTRPTLRAAKKFLKEMDGCPYRNFLPTSVPKPVRCRWWNHRTVWMRYRPFPTTYCPVRHQRLKLEESLFS